MIGVAFRLDDRSYVGTAKARPISQKSSPPSDMSAIRVVGAGRRVGWWSVVGEAEELRVVPSVALRDVVGPGARRVLL